MTGPELPLTSIGIVLSLALLLSILAKRVGLNPLLGFILSGFILGPFVLNFLSPLDPVIFAFSEIGLFVLLFYLGLELSIKEFIEATESIIGIALLDMFFSAGLGFLICIMLGFSPIFAAVVGIMLFSTSSAIVGKFIINNGLIQNVSARTALAILILQDFLGILLLVFVTSVGQSGESPIELGLVSLVFATAAFFAVHRLSKRVEHFFKESGLGTVELTIYALGIGFVVATLGSFLGLSTALGAYFAGFALSATKSGSKIKVELGFLREFFLMFFFVSFGTTLFFNRETGIASLPAAGDLMFVVGIALALGLLAVTAHLIVFHFFGPLFGLNKKDSIMAGALLGPLGEFVIIIATAAQFVLPAAESAIVSPIAFFLIIFTLFAFQPIYSHREFIGDLLEKLPTIFNLKTKETNLEKTTPKESEYLKLVALNLFFVLCMITAARLLIVAIPTLNILPIPYGREISATILTILFCAYPLIEALKYSRLFFNGIIKRYRQALTGARKQARNSD